MAQDGHCHGIAFWFRLELSQGAEIFSAPYNADPAWEQAFQSLDQPLQLNKGETVELLVSHDQRSVYFDMSRRGVS